MRFFGLTLFKRHDAATLKPPADEPVRPTIPIAPARAKASPAPEGPMRIPKDPLTWVGFTGFVLAGVFLAAMHQSEAATAAFVSAFGLLGFGANAAKTATITEGVVEHISDLKAAQALLRTATEEIKDHVIDIRNNPANGGTPTNGATPAPSPSPAPAGK